MMLRTKMLCLNFQDLKFLNSRHVCLTNVLLRKVSKIKRKLDIENIYGDESPSGRFHIMPKLTNENFYGIDSDYGVIYVDKKENSSNFLQKLSSEPTPLIIEEKYNAAKFGAVRYDSENILTIHGQHEIETKIPNVHHGAPNEDYYEIPQPYRKQLFKSYKSKNIKKTSQNSESLASVGQVDGVVAPLEVQTDSKTVFDKSSIKSSSDSCLLQEGRTLYTYPEDISCPVSTNLSCNNSFIDEYYFQKEMTDNSIEEANPVQNPLPIKDMNYVDEIYFGSSTSNEGVTVNDISNENNSYLMHDFQTLKESKDNFGKLLKGGKNVGKELSNNSETVSSKSSSDFETTSLFDEQYFSSVNIDNSIKNNNELKSFASTPKKVPVKEINKGAIDGINCIKTNKNASFHDNAISNEASFASERKVKATIKNNFSMPFNSNGNVEKYNNRSLNHDSLEFHQSKKQFDGVNAESQNDKKFKLILNSQDQHGKHLQNALPEKLVPKNLEPQSKILENPLNDTNNTLDKKIRTAYDFVKDIRKISVESNKGRIPLFTEKLDSKGFRILKYQVPNLLHYTRGEILDMLTGNVLYSDDDIVILNKPYNLIMHDSKSTKSASLSHYIDELAHILDKQNSNPKLITVHRLDKETTGCLLLARNETTALRIKSLFAQRKIQKTYWIVTVRVPDPLQGILDIPITEGLIGQKTRMVLNPNIPNDIKYESHSKGGKRAVTEYKVLAISGNAALVEVYPETGIKHQIRVHFGFGLSCPILGDHKYSSLQKLAPQKLASDLLQRLHVRQSKVRYIPMHIYARSILIPQYSSEGSNLFVQAPMPHHMSKNLQRLKFKKK